MTRITIALFAILLALPAGAQDYPNPFILQRADPWVHRHDDGTYYFIATSPAYDRIELRRSATLAGLAHAEPVVVWERHESGPMSHHIWAPELHHRDGRWYIHFAAGRAEEIWRIRMYVLENTSPDPLEGEWTEKGEVLTGMDTFSLDATMFNHRGTDYLIWAQAEPHAPGTNLYIAAMDTPWSITGTPVVLTRPEFEWEVQRHRVNEGAAVLVRHGRVFVAYSASGTDHNYAVGLLWADEGADLLDPRSWTKSPGPVFRSSHANGIYGPGHNSFTVDEEGRDVLVYHARNYLEIEGDPLRDPNRHTRLQRFGWTPSGFPDFGTPQAESPPLPAPKPLFRDPVHDGAADPVVIWNPHRGRWWMYYTNRRANVEGLRGVTWVHGTRIGIAESSDGGATWSYLGTADIELPAEVGGAEPTHWAPEVITGPDGVHHMYLSVVPGVFETWNHPRSIVHLTSRDMRQWTYQSTLDLSSDRVIDACVARLPGGGWRMWYNNERDGKAIYTADSEDLYTWRDGGKVIGERGEGPKVVHWQGSYWMVTDVWDGLGVFRSDDAETWTRQEGDNLLQHPGQGEDDRVMGGHADIVVQGDRAYLFYFTHPGRTGPGNGYEHRRSSIQVVELEYVDGRLTADRDRTTHIKLDPRWP
jgi:GH43 family beta-xylosidase